MTTHRFVHHHMGAIVGKSGIVLADTFAARIARSRSPFLRWHNNNNTTNKTKLLAKKLKNGGMGGGKQCCAAGSGGSSSSFIILLPLHSSTRLAARHYTAHSPRHSRAGKKFSQIIPSPALFCTNQISSQREI